MNAMRWYERPAAVLNGLVDEHGIGIVVVGAIAVAGFVAPAGAVFEAAIVAGLGTAAAITAARATDGDGELTEVEQIHAEYIDGEIGEVEMEMRVANALDERAQRIREVVESVHNVGPETAAPVAERFESVDDLRTASPSELTQIHGIGDSTAEAICEEVKTVQIDREWKRG